MCVCVCVCVCVVWQCFKDDSFAALFEFFVGGSPARQGFRSHEALDDVRMLDIVMRRAQMHPTHLVQKELQRLEGSARYNKMMDEAWALHRGQVLMAEHLRRDVPENAFEIAAHAAGVGALVHNFVTRVTRKGECPRPVFRGGEELMDVDGAGEGSRGEGAGRQGQGEWSEDEGAESSSEEADGASSSSTSTADLLVDLADS